MQVFDRSLPRYQALVVAARALTPRIREIALTGFRAPLPRFEAGSHIEVAVGPGTIRSYSLANDPEDQDRYVIAVLREPDGAGSGWLHNCVRPGDVLDIAGPRNAFALDRYASEHILLAGGVGITPMLSMMHSLRRATSPFRLIYCTRSEADTAYQAELQDTYGETALIHHDGGDPARSLDLAAVLRDHSDGAHLYVCGPRRLIDAARAASAHWPAGTVHVEVFASPPTAAPTQTTTANQPFEVVLARSGMTLHVPSDKSILEVVLAAGIKAPFVCREGWCGNCETKLLGGEADHRDDILEDDQKAAQDTIHICVSRAMPGQRLILDR